MNLRSFNRVSLILLIAVGAGALSCREEQPAASVASVDAQRPPQPLVEESPRIIAIRAAELPIQLERDSFSEVAFVDGAVVRGVATQARDTEMSGDPVVLYAPAGSTIVQVWYSSTTPLNFGTTRPDPVLQAAGREFHPNGFVVRTPTETTLVFDPRSVVNRADLPRSSNSAAATIGLIFIVPADVEPEHVSIFGSSVPLPEAPWREHR